jgi:hypothetical protein
MSIEPEADSGSRCLLACGHTNGSTCLGEGDPGIDGLDPLRTLVSAGSGRSERIALLRPGIAWLEMAAAIQSGFNTQMTPSAVHLTK